jgi:hypothetical protein
LLSSARAIPAHGSESMLALRVIGAVLAIVFFGVTVARYQRRRISRLSLMISSVIAFAVILLAVVPDLFNPAFETFNFEPDTG